MTSETPGAGQPNPAEPPGPPAASVPPTADASPTEVVAPIPAAGQLPTDEPAATPPPGAELPAAPAPGAELPAAPPPAGPPPTQPGAWGAPPPQQPGGWGTGAAPGGAPQQPGWAPVSGAPGGTAGPGTWNPAPASSSGNGCLKGCIIIAVILAVVAVILLAAAFFFFRQVASDIGVNPDTGEVRECPLISNDELNVVFGGDGAQALPLGGVFGQTVGRFLDNRALKDASACWILGSGTSTTVTGRIAATDAVNASGDYQAAKAAAQAGKYYGGDVSGYGDEAFCTGVSDVGSFGILVRSGGRLAYVSLLNPPSGPIGDWQTSDDGVTTSPDTCALAGSIANAVLR